MRKTLLAMVLLVPALIAAEKDRDWQMGQVVVSKTADARIHNIAGPDKTYIVRGGPDLAVGAPVRYAVMGATMYVSISGSEYKLSIIGATVRLSDTPAPAVIPRPAVTPSPAVTPTPAQPIASPQPVGQPVTPSTPAPAPKAATAPSPAAASTPVAPVKNDVMLDNDSVVKMVVGGLKPDTIVGAIQGWPGKFVLTPEAVAGLKAAGVPQAVIDAMSAKMRP